MVFIQISIVQHRNHFLPWASETISIKVEYQRGGNDWIFEVLFNASEPQEEMDLELLEFDSVKNQWRNAKPAGNDNKGNQFRLLAQLPTFLIALALYQSKFDFPH